MPGESVSKSLRCRGKRLLGSISMREEMMERGTGYIGGGGRKKRVGPTAVGNGPCGDLS